MCGKRELMLGWGQGLRGQASISRPGMRQEDHLGQMSLDPRRALAACVYSFPIFCLELGFYPCAVPEPAASVALGSF